MKDINQIKIVITKFNEEKIVISVYSKQNGKYITRTGKSFDKLDLDLFCLLNRDKSKVRQLVSNIIQNNNELVFNGKPQLHVSDVYYDKLLLNKDLKLSDTILKIKDKHILNEYTPNEDNSVTIEKILDLLNFKSNWEQPNIPEQIENVVSKDMVELTINKLKTVIDTKINAKPNGCLVGSFGYNLTDVVFKENIDKTLLKHMEDALDDIIGTSLSYGVDFDSNLNYLLFIINNENYLFDFDDEIDCITNLHDKVVKCFSKGTNIRSYYIAIKNDTNVLDLINLNTGTVNYFDIDEIKEEIDGVCDCPNCSKKEDLDDDEDKISRRIKEVVDNIFEDTPVIGGYVLLDSPNSDKCFETFEDLKDYCVSNNIDVFKINENVTSYVKSLLGINYNYLRDKYGYTDKVKFYYTSNYFITGPKHITSKIKFKQLKIKS